MALINVTNWTEAITSSVDFATGRVSLRGRRGGMVLTTAGESAERVRTSNYIPKEADSHPDNLTLLVSSVTAEKSKTNIGVEWTAEYQWDSPESIDGGGIGGVPSGWGVQETGLESQQAIDRDVFGAPIMTVTGESPNPPFPDERYDTQYTYTRFGRPYNSTLFRLYRGAVNSDVWLGRPVGSCKMQNITAEVQVRKNEPPQANLTVIVVQGEPPPTNNMSSDELAKGAAYFTWFKRWRAEGFYVKKGVSTAAGITVQLARATDSFGEPTQVPVLHSRSNASQTFDPNFAEWYLTQTRKMLPFNTFFASV